MTTYMFAGMLGGWEIVLILTVILILFGAKKLPELARGLGTGIREFKKATREVTEELNTALDDTHYSPPPPRVEPPQESAPKPVEHHPTAQPTEPKA
jgi:sec-independent protein translocase protein TatA